jgi:hypothetical protein
MGGPPKAGHDGRFVNNIIEADQGLAFRRALENAWDVFMGAGDDVGRVNFSHLFSGCTTRINGGFDGAYVTFDDDADQPAARLLFGDQSHVRGLDHGIGCNCCGVEAYSFD